jgi:hypothetical protein
MKRPKDPLREEGLLKKLVCLTLGQKREVVTRLFEKTAIQDDTDSQRGRI